MDAGPLFLVVDDSVLSQVALDKPVQFIKGVGPVRAAEFERLGIRTIGDLIEYFPFRHALIPKSVAIGDLSEGITATIVGEVRRVRHKPSAQGLVTATIEDPTGKCVVNWFHSAYLAERLERGTVVRLTGKVEGLEKAAAMSNPQTTIMGEDDDPFEHDADRYEAVYEGTNGLPTREIARVLNSVLDGAIDAVEEFLPEELRGKRNLPPRRTAILRFHRPTVADDVAVARRRLAFDELLLGQLALQWNRARQSGGPRGIPMPVTEAIDRRIRARLPFQLTAGQQQSVADISTDLARPVAMNRLLQGDVGAGKTTVAVYATLVAIAHRHQVALLAPTEVLAAQHFAKFEQYLKDSRVRCGLLTGSTPARKREETLAALARGELDLLIGTHALLEPDVRFADLALAIIDEQHKFGVAQRAALRAKGTAPHMLVLSATPIPRTLAMTLFGDLDISTIRDLPPGRQAVATHMVRTEQRAECWQMVRTHIQRGEQAFVVYPLVEESEELELKAASVEARRLAEQELAGFRVELLHGRMSSAEKAQAMERFRTGAAQVLVATTVIEVGVDVPAASIMVIEHAERFGLSQLHQLRGRVGRGDRPAQCLLMTDTMSELPLRRLGILCATNDGFRIAEEDLRLRGPGELIGKRQHGMPAFRVADLVIDLPLLEQARDDAAHLWRSDALLKSSEHAALRRAVLRSYGQVLALGDVG